jgi:hypothetical protein
MVLSIGKGKKYFILIVALLFCLMPTLLVLPTNGQIPDQGSGGVTVKGQSKEYRERVIYKEWTIHNKNCSTTVMYYKEVYTDLWVDEKTKSGSVEWKLVPTPTPKYSFTGSLGGSAKFTLTGPIGNLTPVVPIAVTFSAEVYKTGEVLSWAFSESGPSFDLRNGLAETGPWTVTTDPTTPPIGTIDFASGIFTCKVVYLFDCPNVKVEGGPIPFEETLTGRLSVSVGGIVVPVDKFGLLGPYIGLASTILVATAATAIYVKRVKHRKEKQ